MKKRSAALCALAVIGATACGPGENNANNGTNNQTNTETTGTTGTNGPGCDALTNDDVNGTATLAAGCYTAESTLTVSEGLLTLEPGVVIEFGPDSGLSIEPNGSLSAVGTATDTIVLTGAVEERGYWTGLHFDGSGSPDNKLEYVDLQYAGSTNWHGGDISRGGIFIEGDGNSLTIANTTFLENAQAGLVVDEPQTTLSVTDSHFESNEWPLWVHPTLVGGLASLTFENNDNAYIATALTGSKQSVSTDQTWPAFDIPYRARVELGLEAKLTLSPGVTIVFEQDRGMSISGAGRLTAQGTAEAPITFTGLEAERGFWRGLYFVETLSSDNILDHVVLEYAGSTGWHGGEHSRGGVYLRDEGVALAISNTTFRENAYAAIMADNGAATLTVESSTFESNERPLWVEANLVGGISDDNTFTTNDHGHVRVGGVGSQSPLTTDQQWLTLAVPYRVAGTINASAALTLSPGTTIEFEQDFGLMIDGGTLIADATGGERITFTAANGETLNGFWKGIYFTNTFSTSNIIANADILYAGSSGWHGGADSQAALFLRGGTGKSSVGLSDVKIANSGYWGLSVESGSVVAPCDSVTFENNTQGPSLLEDPAASACLP